MSVRSLRYNTIEQHFTKSALASTDRDALAFLEAAQIYNTNQQRAIVNLVRSLKRVGLWSKMKAIYPFVGGTATSHKFNLKDPRDADAAFRLSFQGGWTHSATGADPNGTNAYADTYWLPSVQGSQNSMHISYYSRQNATAVEVEMGSSNATSGSVDRAFIEANTAGITYAGVNGTAPNDFVQFADTDAKAYYIANRTASNVQNVFRNTVKGGTNTKASTGLPTLNIVIGAQLINTGASNFTTKQCAFATIGDGLTDTDATNLYNIVQRYQFQLGRAIEPDAQAFIDAAGITDATQQAAILDLVVRLKNDGLWSKMKAIYPFVGGTASTHKWNLKDPRDSDAAFRLTFSGGWTHSADGALPNGTNAYGDTFVVPNTNLTLNSTHMSYYSRTANTTNSVTEMGCSSGASELPIMIMEFARNGTNAISDAYHYTNNRINVANTVTTGLLISTRTTATSHKLYRNTTTLGTDTANQAQTGMPTNQLALAGYRSSLTAAVDRFSTKQCAFATIGDGLTDTDATNLYNIVDLYQRRLGRNV